MDRRVASVVLIIDQGSTSIHVGLNTDKKPVLSFKEPFFYICKEDNEIRFGEQDVELDKEPVKIYRIFHEDGQVKNWSHWTKFMWHIIRMLKVTPSETSLFLIDHPNRAKGLRQDAVRICFETLKFHSVFIGYQPGVILTASDLATGLVVHSGYTSTYVVPVYKMEQMSHALCVLEIGGYHITKLLAALIKKKYKLDLPYTVANRVKEDICYVAEDDIDDAEEEAESHMVFWADGGIKVIDEIGAERVIAPEVLFDPQLLEMDEWGVHEWAHYAIHNCSGNKFVKDLWRNIVVSGGTTNLKGFSKRLHKELTQLAPDDVEVRIVPCPEGVNPSHMAFVGAVKMIKFDSFGDFLLYRKDYKREGIEACMARSLSHAAIV
eukprot:TRINITY_DN3396_c0_g1_i4.p1 TRINITY_DN3396_c0_g1~~TRINITY_DN3396_c0_g1_i4.p1  ORF type:complete len:378 (-),score=64.11 TRINITY_DN3396_c0_g1_i4:141-1274(-)